MRNEVPSNPIESVDNARKLLLLLGEQPQIRLSEATRYLGVRPSTAHRLLAMLAYRGFVRQDPDSKAYLPGPALTSVAFAIFGRVDIQRTAMPVMRGLSEHWASRFTSECSTAPTSVSSPRSRALKRSGGVPVGAHDARPLHLDRQGVTG